MGWAAGRCGHQLAGQERRVARPGPVGLGALFLVVGALCAPGPTFSEEFEAKVIGVVDGDTIDVLRDEVPVRLRLVEIDAPELGQPWGRRAKQEVARLVHGRVVRVVLVEPDRYDRWLADVFVGDLHLNRALVLGGHAWAYLKYLRDPRFVTYEATAREAGRGLWSLSEVPFPPWEWRTGARPAPAEPEFAEGCMGKRYCREMASCEEAIHNLRECGVLSLDGDGDGVPCETLCR